MQLYKSTGGGASTAVQSRLWDGCYEIMAVSVSGVSGTKCTSLDCQREVQKINQE